MFGLSITGIMFVSLWVLNAGALVTEASRRWPATARTRLLLNMNTNTSSVLRQVMTAIGELETPHHQPDYEQQPEQAEPVRGQEEQQAERVEEMEPVLEQGDHGHQEGQMTLFTLGNNIRVQVAPEHAPQVQQVQPQQQQQVQDHYNPLQNLGQLVLPVRRFIPQYLGCDSCHEFPEKEVYRCAKSHFACKPCYKQKKACPRCKKSAAPDPDAMNFFMLLKEKHTKVICPASYSQDCVVESNRGEMLDHLKVCQYVNRATLGPTGEFAIHIIQIQPRQYDKVMNRNGSFAWRPDVYFPRGCLDTAVIVQLVKEGPEWKFHLSMLTTSKRTYHGTRLQLFSVDNLSKPILLFSTDPAQYTYPCDQPSLQQSYVVITTNQIKQLPSSHSDAAVSLFCYTLQYVTFP